MNEKIWASWQGNFFAGLAIVLPGVVSIALLVWLFGTVTGFTDTLLFFLPRHVTHANNGQGAMHWYWSFAAVVIAIALTTGIGMLARIYVGKKLIQLADFILLRVPLLNKIYGTIKQVNEAFGSGSKSSFKQVVLVEFPRPGQHSVGFVTGDSHSSLKPGEKLASVFIPTTPNPTTGFLVLVPEASLIKVEMSVAEGLKFIVSLGAITPEKTALDPSQISNFKSQTS